jgi:radical SAM family uncharacterized protein/radical SAM-linked protein
MKVPLNRNDMLTIQKPGRYIGGELNIPDKDFENSSVRVVAAYPDVYEIGMSNHGLRIIYDRINQMKKASCERVYSPWTDFSQYLEENDIPLFSLETRTPVQEFDLLGISIQYELLFTNFLHMLTLSKIPLLSSERGDEYPIVLLGGPGVSNPAPFARFADAIFAGEVELRLESIISTLSSSKEEGLSKFETLKILSGIPGVYVPGITTEPVQRQIHGDFSKDVGLTRYLVPTIDIVQNKLVVEIMRGCPNKCRFCQAGIMYKPARERPVGCILDAVDYGLSQMGVSEVTLSSLSSADYSCVLQLAEEFNKRFKERNISFSFPSLRVESFPEDLLDTISSVRKSGLTFAVETGSIEGQKAINKPVLLDTLLSIIGYAVSRGWRLFKFYFMIGLPDQIDEKETIIEFLEKVRSYHRGIQINCNLAVFIPKPHTPYEKAAQMPLEKSIGIINEIREHFRRGKVKIKAHDPYTSHLEGLISRGDSKTGELVLDAYRAGARFCGWNEHFNYNFYSRFFEKYNIQDEVTLGERPVDQIEPWSVIDPGVEQSFFDKERENSMYGVINNSCTTTCDNECHICANMASQKRNLDQRESINIPEIPKIPATIDVTSRGYLVRFAKRNDISLIGHKDMIHTFERMLYRSRLPVQFSEGFNPRPKMQFSPPLPLGMESESELGTFKLHGTYEPVELLKYLSNFTHPDIPLLELAPLPADMKKFSLMELQQSADYTITFNQVDHETIKQAVELYNKTGLEYSFERKGKEINGRFEQYLDIVEVTGSNILIAVTKIVPSPRLDHFCKLLLPGVTYSAKRTAQYTKTEQGKMDLFKFLAARLD